MTLKYGCPPPSKARIIGYLERNGTATIRTMNWVFRTELPKLCALLKELEQAGTIKSMGKDVKQYYLTTPCALDTVWPIRLPDSTTSRIVMRA
jgi:hypothetical protein